MDEHPGPITAPMTPTRRGQASAPFLCRFQLLEALSPGHSARAQLVYWVGSPAELSPLSGSSLEVTIHSAIGGFSGATGDQGYAIYWSDARRFESLAAGSGGSFDACGAPLDDSLPIFDDIPDESLGDYMILARRISTGCKGWIPIGTCPPCGSDSSSGSVSGSGSGSGGGG